MRRPEKCGPVSHGALANYGASKFMLSSLSWAMESTERGNYEDGILW